MKFIVKLLQRFNLLPHRLDLIPQAELEKMQCCRCPRPAIEQWMQGVCADTKTRGQFSPVCVECDIELNQHHLRFFFGSEREDDLEKYAVIKRAKARRKGLL